MIVITEADLGIVCDGDNQRCTGEATYVVVVHADSVLVRMYCKECTKRLAEGVADVMRRNDDETPIHDVLEVEHIHSDRVVM